MSDDDDFMLLRIPLKGLLFKGKGEARKWLTQLEDNVIAHEQRMRAFVKRYQIEEPKPRQFTLVYQQGVDQRRLRWRQSGARERSKFVPLFDSDEGDQFISKLPRHRKMQMQQYELERIRLNAVMGFLIHSARETRRYLEEMRLLDASVRGSSNPTQA